MKKTILSLLSLIVLINSINAASRRFRATYRSDPSTTISIGWDQYSGSSPVFYYGTVDHGINWNLYPNQAVPVISNTEAGMNNTFVRLSGLVPDTEYYFVVKDNVGTSQRYSFQTGSNDPTKPISLVCGADTRTGIAQQIIGFKLVAKLRPQAVIFGGDFTDAGSDSELQQWFDNWQLSITADGRLIPIVIAEGNHEYLPATTNLSNLFDIPNDGIDFHNNYYSISFGGSLLRVYNLNSNIPDLPTQTNWLKNQLISYAGATTWNMAQYHLPVRPTSFGKSDNQNEYNQWVPLFEQYGVKLVQEADAHLFKITWPILKSSATGNDEGFIRNDMNGIVYFGDGGWGAPLRIPDNPKSWTRGFESIYHFSLIHFYPNKVHLFTVKFESEPNIPALTDANRMSVPYQLSLEDLIDRNGINSGDYVTISKVGYPYVTIVEPQRNQIYLTPQTITIKANASSTTSTGIKQVEFFVNNTSVGIDTSTPYQINWPIPSVGNYHLTAKATGNNNNVADSQEILLFCGDLTTSLNDDTDNTIAIFPTIVTDYLHVRLGNSDNISTIRILDLNGRILSPSQEYQGDNLQINMENYSPGLYVAQIRNKNGVKTFKIIKH